MIMSETQEQQIRELRDKNINGMEKWNEKTYGGGWEMSRHLEGGFAPK